MRSEVGPQSFETSGAKWTEDFFCGGEQSARSTSTGSGEARGCSRDCGESELVAASSGEAVVDAAANIREEGGTSDERRRVRSSGSGAGGEAD